MKNDHLQMEKCPRCGTPEGFDNGRNCAICGLQIRTEEEYRQWLAYHGVSPQQSEPKVSPEQSEPKAGTRVTVLREHVRFPRICPHCSADASVPVGLQEIRFSAYIFMRLHTIYAPFCHSYAKKVVWVQRLLKTCVILFLVLLAAGFNPPVWAIFILVGASIARLYWTPNKYIRITDIQKDSIQFSIANPIYAQEFRRLNATSL
jgi:hypothetical protein